MIAGHRQHRQRQALDEGARRGELAPARALGDVAAQHDQVGRLGGGQVQRGLDHGLALGAEMRVGKCRIRVM